MWSSKLLVSCACLLLLHLEMGAARACNSRFIECLHATADRLGLQPNGVEYIWTTRKPLVIMPDDETTVTYTLQPDTRTITKTMKTKFLSRQFYNQSGSWSVWKFQERISTNSYSHCCQWFNNFPNNPSPPTPKLNPNDRLPNEHNPGVRPPNERPAYTPNTDESNTNDSQWVPIPQETTEAPGVPLPTRAPSNDPRVDTVIDDFLAKVDVTTADIKEDDGEYVRTIVDENGRILKAKFELVEPKSQDGKQIRN